MDMERVRDFITLTARKRDLEAQLRKVTAQVDHQEAQLLDSLASSGELTHFEHIKVDGATLGLRRTYYATQRDGFTGDPCDALIAAGMGELVRRRYNTQTLNAWLGEQMEQERPLPAVFEMAFETCLRHKLVVRNPKAANGAQTPEKEEAE